MMWGVFFDTGEAEEDFEMVGIVRWVDRDTPLGELVMYESEVTISKEEPFFYSGLGDEGARLWRPGFYRVEFLDDRDILSVAWEFEVR